MSEAPDWKAYAKERQALEVVEGRNDLDVAEAVWRRALELLAGAIGDRSRLVDSEDIKDAFALAWREVCGG